MELSQSADEAQRRRDLVVVGASAGGVETLQRVVRDLPGDLGAAICVVVHIAPRSPSALAEILDRAGPLGARQAQDRDPLVASEILVAPPDRHLMIEDDRVRLTVGPRENGHRPAVDPLFRSAAARGARVVGVVLSGNRDDGAAGLAAIKQSGGAAIVQDPEEALFPGMPASALANVVADSVVPSDRIAQAIAAMVSSNDPRTPTPNDPSDRDEPARESKSAMACPECGGVLVERPEAHVPQWRCQVGHRYSQESLADAQGASVEAALWSAIRALHERGDLLERLAQHCESRGRDRSAKTFRSKSHDARQQADLVRGALDRAAVTSLRDIDEDELAGSVDQELAS